ncbi:lysophospholipid acyltransferase family protein [Lentiprolixibacter aurantiacus]|uniref:Lysophospholipid acyltransferase family protein n=1 Tax=Lentiprolixibacter aurantiacus TaxID=2993939 RepID=A0AAE3MN76_9FLAO|nr:lysophospholipid acyltransferase family protein [Lentiprolixibacter aurantiacus]MCX2720508.1 lysophospholipid acyltransferase family protein [Lentiprolixibacter aurantiacus]
MRTALHCYFGRINLHGLDGIPEKGPLMFLPNHQNALLDALLIAVNCRRKPYFLTRSDVFSNRLFRSLFSFFHMLPVYRIRDGRHTLSRNEAIFQKCAELLCQGEAVVIFPEANHHLDRRVRPLSKGFTRILFQAVELCNGQEIFLLPVGVNYLRAAQFPDLTSLYYGRAFPLLPLYDARDPRNSVFRIRNEVSQQLQTLTTHVPEDKKYEQFIAYLISRGIDFQDPEKANQAIAGFTENMVDFPDEMVKKRRTGILRLIFYLFNFPLVIPWFWIKNRLVPEPEFNSTFRFAYALMIYPLVYLICFFLISSLWGYAQALTLIALHFGVNQVYIKVVREN